LLTALTGKARPEATTAEIEVRSESRFACLHFHLLLHNAAKKGRIFRRAIPIPNSGRLGLRFFLFFDLDYSLHITEPGR
jgi:hypothetical protein